MTSQLSLITTESAGTTGPEPTSGAEPDSARPATEVGSVRSRPVSVIGRLDRRTITRGRRGVAAARAELQDATARAAERQRARMEERIARLEELSQGSRTAGPDGDGPGTEHRAA